jgi:hypothetical protein
MLPTTTRDTELQNTVVYVSSSTRLHWSRLRVLTNSNLALFFVATALVLVPCFWQSRIQAGDLSSHLYNAWLTQLIKHGQIKSLWIARQWDNILFDLSLEWLLVHFGVRIAERMAVALAVLIFFWGGFTLLCTVTTKRPWFVAPCLAMLAYGYVFHMGFFNFYLSLGLSFFALALLWRGSWGYALIALLLLAVAWTAHPVPVLWCLATTAYTWIARAIPFKWQLALFAISVTLLYFLRHFLVRLPNQWSWRQLALITGADQLVVYGTHYVILGICLLFLWGTLYLRTSRNGSRVAFSVPVQLMLLAGVGTFLLPDAVLAPGYSAPLSFLMARMSITTAMLACCVSGSAAATRFHRYAFGLLALTFFACLYVDHRALNRIENNVSQLVRQLPAGQRVVASVSLPNARIQPLHIVDRACIGHCFSYANYEPSTGQFRVRTTPHNSVVVSDDSDSRALQAGCYFVRASDLPLYQIHSCGRKDADLCLRSLKAGETNGSAEF